MKPIKAAIIGTGFIGPAHLEALRRIGNVEIAALASQELPKARELAQTFGIPSVHEDWRAVIDDPSIRVLHVCTPNNLHYAINRAAMRAGKHVVCEKPLTLTSKESASLVALAREQALVNAIVYNYRMYPLIQQARSMVQSGVLGSIYLVHGHYLQDWLYYRNDYNWRLEPAVSGASRAVADIGSHLCDLVQYVTGLTIESVCADLVTVHKTRLKPKRAVETFQKRGNPSVQKVGIATEDAGAFIVRFNNGAQGVFSVSQVSAGRKNYQWFEIDGSAQSVSWNQENPNELWIGHREKANEILVKDPSLMSDEARRNAHYPGGHPEGYPDVLKNLFREIYDVIGSGADPRRMRCPFPTFADGHHGIKVVEAVLKSSKTKRWVHV